MVKQVSIYKEKHETGYKCEYKNCDSNNAVINHKGTYFCATHAYWILTGRMMSLDLNEDVKDNRADNLVYCNEGDEINVSNKPLTLTTRRCA